MKKILITILGLLIGFVGFSSAVEYYIQFAYDDNLTIVDHNNGVTYTDRLFVSAPNRSNNILDTSISFSGISSPVILKEICLLGNLSVFTQSNNYLSNTNIKAVDSGYYKCFDVSSLNLNISSDPFFYYLTNSSNNNGKYYGLFSVNGGAFSNEWTGNFAMMNFSFYNLIPGFDDVVINFDGGRINQQYPIPYSIVVDIQAAPKFTVNYGSQSKEYTVDQDIDIFINSPVIKNGNTFSYDGSTGINLVYNGQYNRYTKNKLYLDGQFWYRQGVFTPICL